MAVDWSALVGDPLARIFGTPVRYEPAAGSPIAGWGAFEVLGVFDQAYTPVSLGAEPDAISSRPVLGVQLSEFPAGFDPELAQGDRFTLLNEITLLPLEGRTYVVKAAKPDGHGHVRLEANAA